MHETVPLQPAEPKSTLLACLSLSVGREAGSRVVSVARWLRSVVARTRKPYHIHIVLTRQSPMSRLSLRVAPIVASRNLGLHPHSQGLRRPRNKSSPVW